MKNVVLTELQKKRINDILSQEGFLDKEKDVILSSFKEFGNHYEFYGNNTNYSNALLPINRNKINGNKGENISIYKQLREGKEKEYIKNLSSILKQKNLTLPDALALNFYSNNQIVSEIKRMEVVKKYSYLNYIQKELRKSMFSAEECDEKLNALFDFIHSLDYNHEDYYKTIMVYASKDYFLSDFLSEINLYAIRYKFYCNSFSVIKHLDKTLKSQIPYNIVVYRGIEKREFSNLLYLNDGFFDKEDPSSLVGNKISDNGYTSTSLRYDMCFASKSYRNLILKILVPKGSQGMDISNFSSYESEEEILFNSNDIYLIDYDYVDDVNQHCFTALLLSKDRSCYKDIGNNINIDKIEEENE